MDRRQFLSAGAASAAAAMAAGKSFAQEDDDDIMGKKFSRKYAPHAGMFKHHAGNDYIDQIKFAADVGFTAWEDNRMARRPVELQKEAGRVLKERGMTMGVFVTGSGNLPSKTDKAFQDDLRKKVRQSIEVAKRVGATWTTVVPGSVVQSLAPGYQTANCIENLKVMAEECEPAGLVMVLEPLNWYANHPGRFLRGVPQAYEICKAVDSPSCKILNDLYHQQVDIGNLIPNLEKAWDETPYIQMGDNPGRKEPLTGEINYREIFGWLADKGYDGVIGMEHGNSQGGKEGEKRLIRAYRWCDNYDEDVV